MSEHPPDIDEVLLLAESAGAALHSVFLIRKKTDKTLSVRRLARDVSLKSPGNLGDFFKSRRNLKTEYVTALCKALKLKGAQAKFIKHLNLLDLSKTPAERVSAQNKLNKTRRLLMYQSTEFESNNSQLSLLKLKLVGLISILNPTIAELKKVLTSADANIVQMALAQMLKSKLVDVNDGRYLLNENYLELYGDLGSRKALYKASLREAHEQSSQHFDNVEHAAFDSAYLTCKKENLSELVKQVRNAFEDLIVDVEHESGDSIVHLGMFYYPYYQRNS